MLLSHKKNSQSLPDIKTKPILKANFSAVKQSNNTKKNQQCIKKNIKPLIYPNITIIRLFHHINNYFFLLYLSF